MKYKISLYGSGYRVNTHRVPKRIFNRLEDAYENANLDNSEGMSSLERSFEKILDIENIWNIFWDSGHPGTILEDDLFGLYHPYLEVQDLLSHENITKEINIKPFMDKLFCRFGYAAAVLWDSDDEDSVDGKYEWPKGIVNIKDSEKCKIAGMPYLFFACECLKGIRWEGELELEGEFDINKLSPVVQEYPEGVHLVVGLAYNGTQLNLEDNHEEGGSGYTDYFFSLTPSFERLELNGLTSLSVNAAQAFSKHAGTLCLNGLNELSDNAAEYLSNHVGVLELRGLVSLSEIAVENLFGHTGKIILSDSIILSDTSRQRLSERETYSWANNTNFSNLELDKTDAPKNGIINMDHLTFLSDQEASDISSQNGRTLRLNGLTELTEVAADLLAEFKGDAIELNGLKELSDEVAEKLGAFKGGLLLNGLNFLSDRGAKALSNRYIPEGVEGVTITEEEAKILAEKEGDLDLNHLTSLSVGVAIQLSKHKGGGLKLNGIKRLSSNTADYIGRHDGDLALNGLTNLSPNIARFLAPAFGFQNQILDHALYLNGLTALSAETAKALSNHRGRLILNRLSSLSETAAEALSGHKGSYLSLCGIKEISDKSAEYLSKHSQVNLLGLTALSSVAAKILLKFDEDLSLNKIKSLSHEAAKTLSKHKGWLELNGLTSITSEVATALSKHKGWLDLSGLINISDDVAIALSKHKGRLGLNGINNLSYEAAEAFSKHINNLHLNGLANPSDKILDALSKHKGGLYLNGLTTLSDEAAEMLANHIGQISLCGITNLSDKAIEALSKHNGNLILDGLISISDQAALAISRRMQLNISDDSKTVSLCGLQTVSDFALNTVCEFVENGSIRIDSPAIIIRIRKCIDELNETRFEKVPTKDLVNQKVIGRKLAVRASKYWSEDFTDEDTGETTSLNLNETIVEAGKKLTKKQITDLINSGVEFIFLERE
jgi:hypothetical protein